MGSTSETNLSPESGTVKGAKRVIGGRADPGEIALIDQAAAELGQIRGVFIVRASIALARRVLAKEAA